MSISRGTFLVLSMSKGSDTASSSSSSMFLPEESPDSTSWCRPDVETLSCNRPLPELEESRDVIFWLGSDWSTSQERWHSTHTHNRPTLTTAEPIRPETKRGEKRSDSKNQKSKTQTILNNKRKEREKKVVDVNSGRRLCYFWKSDEIGGMSSRKKRSDHIPNLGNNREAKRWDWCLKLNNARNCVRQWQPNWCGGRVSETARWPLHWSSKGRSREKGKAENRHENGDPLELRAGWARNWSVHCPQCYRSSSNAKFRRNFLKPRIELSLPRIFK